MIVARGKSQAEALKYSIEQQAEANKLLLTPEYLSYLRAKTEFRNMKMYIGDRVPRAIIEEREETPISATSLHSAIEAQSPH